MSSLPLLLPLLATLLLNTQTPPEAAASPASPSSSSSSTHTPSTAHLEAGDWDNARFLAVQRSVGLIHTYSAQLGNPGVLHLSLLTSYAHTKNFSAISTADVRYSDVSQWVAAFSTAWVFLPWLEAHASYEVSSSFATVNTSQAPKPSPASGQILGDINLGLKFAHNFVPSFYTGVDLGLRVSTVDQQMRDISFAFRPSLLLSWNVQELPSRVPLILHANFGVHLGRNGNASLVAADLQRPQNTDRWKAFSLNLNSRHYAFLSFALEAPLPYATPFVEYQAALPFWTQTDNAQTPPLAKTTPQSLTVGTKLTMSPNFTFTLGADINLKSASVPSLSAQPPWRVFLGFSLAVAPLSQYKTPLPHPAAGSHPAAFPIAGTLLNALTHEPIANAEIKLVQQHLQTQLDGHFQTQALPPGLYTLEASAPGFVPQTQHLEHDKNNTHIIPLEPVLIQPQLSLLLKRGNKFVPARVSLRGNNPQNFSVNETNPSFNLPAGPQLLEILPKEGLAKILKTNLSHNQKETLTLDIESTPSPALVRLSNQRILLADPLAFSNNNSELTPRGHAQLRSLVSLLVRNNIQKIRLESHVESQKTEAKAMQLAAQRSQVVVDALAQLGVDSERIEVLNLGDTKPVAPNVRKGRMLNRRVDFVALKKWSPPPAPSSAPLP